MSGNPMPLVWSNQLQQQPPHFVGQGSWMNMPQLPPTNFSAQSQQVFSHGSSGQSSPMTVQDGYAQSQQVLLNGDPVQSSPMPVVAHPIDGQAFGGPLLQPNGCGGGAPAEESDAEPLFFLGNRIEMTDNLRTPVEIGEDGKVSLIAPDPSKYPCFAAESCGVHVPTHEDYGLTDENCRRYGDMPSHKGLRVFCLTCREPLSTFDLRCGLCKRYRDEHPGELEGRSCIICKFHTTYFDTIFCEYHISLPNRFSHDERRILERAGICNSCLQMDVSAQGGRTCNDCKEKRKAQYRDLKERKRQVKALELSN